MNFADIQVGTSYRLIDVAKVGKPGNLLGVTLGAQYNILEKTAPDSVRIVNDNGKFVLIKAFRFERIERVPAPDWQGQPFDIRPPGVVIPEQAPVIRGWDDDGLWPEDGPQPIAAPAPWVPKVGDKVRIKAVAFRHRGDPGWNEGGMGPYLNKTGVIKTANAGRGWYTIEFDNDPGNKGRVFNWTREWMDFVAEKKPFEWVKGAKVHLKNEDEGWFHDNPAPNNPGWCNEMNDFRGKEMVIRKFAGIKDRWIKLEGDPDDYSYAKEWFEEFDGEFVAKAPAPKPIPPKFKVGDAAVVQDGVFDKADRWIKDMDETFGSLVVVIANDNGWLACDNGYSYPMDALRKPNKEEEKLAIAAKLREAQKNNLAEAEAKSGGVSSFVKWYEKDGVISKTAHYSTICHASLSYQDYDRGNLVGVTDYLFAYKTQVEKEQHADYKAFVDYVINRSPWHPFWKKSSVDRALKEGLQLKIDVPARQVASACVAVRMGKEFSKAKLPIFTMLVNAGYEEAVAWVLMQCFAKYGDGVRKELPTGAHTVIGTATKIGPLLHLMRYGYDEKSLKAAPYSKAPGYRGFTEQINEQPNPLKEDINIINFLTVNAKGKTAGSGFDAVTTWTEKDVFSCADILTNLLHKLDVME